MQTSEGMLLSRDMTLDSDECEEFVVFKHLFLCAEWLCKQVTRNLGAPSNYLLGNVQSCSATMLSTNTLSSPMRHWWDGGGGEAGRLIHSDSELLYSILCSIFFPLRFYTFSCQHFSSWICKLLTIMISTTTLCLGFHFAYLAQLWFTYVLTP